MLQRLFCAASVFFVLGCVSEPKADEVPPNVLLTHPPMGAWIEDSTVSVSGQANGLASVDVNGVTVPVVDGWFEHTMVPIHGVNVIEVEGTDVYGDRHFVRRGVLAGPFTTPKTTVEDAAMLRINRTGLAVLEGQLHQWVEPETLAADAIAMNPIYQDSYGFMGWDAVTVSADLDAVSFQVPELTLNPRDGFLYMEVVIPDVSVDVAVYGDVAGVDFEEPVWVTAESATLTSEIVLSAYEGKPVAVLVSPSFELDRFFMDTSLLPGALEQTLLGDAVQGQLEDLITETIVEAIPELLESEIAGLNLSKEDGVTR